MSIHAAPADSPRLAPVLALLRARGGAGATSLELAGTNGSMAPHTDVAELRAGGLRIACEYVGRSATGRKVYRYVLEGETA